MVSACSEKASKSLVLYYSQNGGTESVAMEIQKQVGADIEKFDVVEVYDGDYDVTLQRGFAERESGFVPTLVPLKCDLSKYDVIYLGYPIWFGTYATPVKALLGCVDLSGKKIVPFCTFGSCGLETSIADLKAAVPDAEITNGFGIRQARLQYTSEELDRFLIENGLKDGSVDPLPDYSEQDSATPEELALYNEAVSGYPYPIGTPVSVGARTVPGGVDYLFTVETVNIQGEPSQGKVYVVRRNGRPTEFTRVYR